MAKKLFLVDGSNQAFRAYHAIQTDLRAPDGFPTRALLGFSRMLLKMTREHEPDYVAVVFDKGRSFRNELYPDYKGQRPDMPEDLRQQWDELVPLCEDFGYRALAIEGMEADDVIGTLARRFAGRPDPSGEPVEAWIVSGDKDFAQLVDEHVLLFDIQRDIVYDEARVKERWGVPPSRMIDLLSLMGDTSDNVPGVKGVGPKTAARFLQRYDTLDNVVAHADQIGGKTGQRIAEAAQTVRLARQLVTIRTDMPVEATLDDLVPSAPHAEALSQRLSRYGFTRLIEELELARKPLSGRHELTIDRDAYEAITTRAQLDALATALRQAGRFAFDTETDSLDAIEARLVGMSFCWADGEAVRAVYVPIAHRDGSNCPDAVAVLGPILADPAVEKVGQNLKYDMKVLSSNGLILRGIAGDTMLADYLLEVEQKHNLDELAMRYLGHRMISFNEVCGAFDHDFSRVDVPTATRYAAEDAHVAWLLDTLLEPRLVEQGLAQVYRQVEVPLIEVLASMELAGIGVDRESLEALSTELGERIDRIQAEIHELAGEEFNLNSTQQLATILFEKRGHKPIKKTKTGYSTNQAVLEELAMNGDDPLPARILAYRELAKLKSTYVDALPKCIAADGRIHTSFHQAVAATGRLSSNDPNLQNIPVRTAEGRRIRRCFVARPGHQFLSADYSQVELRVLAHFCETGPLVEAFRAGEDIHRRTASEIFGVPPMSVSPEQRRAAKAINFGIVYGMSAFRLARELSISRHEAERYIDDYFARYPQVRAYMDRMIALARERGYVSTMLGRRRPVRGLSSRNPAERGAAERIAINTPVQGTAADLIKLAMIRVHRRLASDLPRARLLLQVHDELVLEVPDEDISAAEDLVRTEMSGVADLLVPLLVDTGTGRTWDEAH